MKDHLLSLFSDYCSIQLTTQLLTNYDNNVIASIIYEIESLLQEI